MSRTNNFGRLNEQDEARFEGDRIQDNLWQTLGVFRFVGEIVEVYFPRMIDVIIAAVGGKTNKGESRSAYPPSSIDQTGDAGRDAPGK